MDSKFTTLLQNPKFVAAVVYYDSNYATAQGSNDTKKMMARELTTLYFTRAGIANQQAVEAVDTIEEYREVRSAEVQPPTPSFYQIAMAATQRGEYRGLPILVGAKNPLITWRDTDIDKASTEDWKKLHADWVQKIATQYPNANAATIAKPEENLYIDEDKSDQFRKGYEAFAGESFPRSHSTSARPDHLQSGWKQTDYSRAKLWNIVQGKTRDQMFSLRFRNMYALAEGSLHPKGTVYTAVDNSPLLPIPDRLVDYILSCVVDVSWERGSRVELNEDGASKQGGNWFESFSLDEPFIHGSIDNTVKDFIWYYIKHKNVSDGQQLWEIIEDKFEKNGCFEPDGTSPFHWNRDQIRKKCFDKTKSIRTGEQDRKAEEQKALAESAATAAAALKAMATIQPVDLIQNMKPDAPQAQVVVVHPEIDTNEACARPVFPYWAIMGTSIWDGLVAPALASSSKHAEFIYLPAMQMVMNYLSGQVTIGMHTLRMNLFLGLVSPYGKFFKSSSCELAHDYCARMNICTKMTKGTVAASRTLVGQAGSPEGFGIEVQKAHGAHAVLYNDELGKFASKAGIESSSFADDLLTWYGAGDFGNKVSNVKKNFQFEAGKYTFGWLWCTTDRGFNRHWPKLAGIVSGLEDRMFFVVSPEKPKTTVLFHDPLLVGSIETRKRIDAAIAKKEYALEDPTYFSNKVAGMDPRSMELVMNLALFLTIDMGLEKIDDEVIERALALVAYRNQAAAFLEPIEADNQQGRLQKEILRELRQNRGKMSYRQLCLNLDYHRYGADVWNRAYKTMLPYGNDEGQIYEWPEHTTPGKRATRMVGIIKFDDDSLPGRGKGES